MDGIRKKVTDIKKTGVSKQPVFPVTTSLPIRTHKPEITHTPVVHQREFTSVVKSVVTDSEKSLADTIYINARNRKYRTWTGILFVIVVILASIFFLITDVFDQTRITILPVQYHHTGTDIVNATIYPTVRSLQYFVVTEQITQTEPIDKQAIYKLLYKQIPAGSFSTPELVVVSAPITDIQTNETQGTSYFASLIFFKQLDIQNYIREYIFQTRFPLIFSNTDDIQITLAQPVFINAKTPLATIPVQLSGDFSAVSYINPDTVRDLSAGIQRSLCRKTLEQNDTIGIDRALCHVIPIWRLKTSDGEHKITVILDK